MDLDHLLDELNSKGVRLQIQAGKLRCLAKNGVLTSELHAAIAEHKAVLVRLLLQAAGPADMPPAIIRRNGGRNIPLSFAQSMYWNIHHSVDCNHARLNLVSGFEFSEPVELETLKRALQKLVASCEILRTAFPLADTGGPLQVISSTESIRISDFLDCYDGIEDKDFLSLDADGIVRYLQQYKFDLAHAPLFRIFLIDDKYAGTGKLVFCIHRIICDGYSLEILKSELEKNIGSIKSGVSDAGPDDLQYADFSCWQHDNFSTGEFSRKHRVFWRNYLPDPSIAWSGIPRKTAHVGVGECAEVLTCSLTTGMMNSVLLYSATEKVALFSVLLAAFKIFLARHLGAEDVVIYTAFSGRNHPALHNMIGCFVRTVKLRTRTANFGSFSELVRAVNQTATDIQSHIDVPNECINDYKSIYAKDIKGNIPITFLMQNQSDSALALPAAGEIVSRASSNIYNFFFSVLKSQTGLALSVNYNTSFYTREEMTSVLNGYIDCLGYCINSPGGAIVRAGTGGKYKVSPYAK